MNKLFKGTLATLLAIGFLAGCGGKNSSEAPVSQQSSVSEAVTTHWVTFYMDTLGGFYKEIEVVNGEKVEMPADPTREGYTFIGWFTDTAFTTPFDPNVAITEPVNVYAKFSKDYVPDTNTYHIVGDMQNTDISFINWNATGTEGIDWDVRSYLTKAEDSNLFTIELEIGYLGKFKIKQPGEPWNEGIEYDFTDIAVANQFEYLQEADNRNIQVKTAGKYRIELETTLETVIVTRIGDAVGEGVKQDPDPDAVVKWGLVGTINNWGETEDIEFNYNLEGEYHYIPAYYFEKDAKFKLRVDNSWGIEIGYQEGMELPEGIIITDLEEGLPKVGADFVVDKAGFYSLLITKDEADKFVLEIFETGFALRGTATAGGWNADSEPLAFIGQETVEEVTTYTYEGTFELTVGEFKVKMAAFGLFSGWDYAFGDEDGANFAVATAGTYKVTLNVVYDVETLGFTGTATFAPVAA